MSYELIPLTQFPSMAAPWSSKDAGEAWAWGDFFAIIQKEPISIEEVAQAMTGKGKSTPAGITYLYAMTVFYNKDKNPHGPSSLPVLSIGLERANYGAMASLLGMDKSAIEGVTGNSNGPVMVGMFKGQFRANLGEFKELISIDSVRNEFLNIMGQQLDLAGEPEYIGSMNDAQGHPQTGWPKNEGKSQRASQSSGCLSMIVGVLALPPLLWGISQLS